MNASMIPENIVGNAFLDRRSQFVTDTVLNLIEKAIAGPSLLHKEVFQAGAIPALAQSLLVPEDFRNRANNRRSLLGWYKSIQPNRQMRLVGKAAADPDRVANLGASTSTTPRTL
jgi:hypothetical protein